MLNNKKLIESREDTLAQQETGSLSWLRTVAPIFPVNGSKITIIHKPQMFYTTLLEKCERAKKRITFASLYLGTGPLETELLSNSIFLENEVSFLGAGERYRESDEYKRRQPTSADSPGLHEGFTGQAELPKDARAIAQRQIW